MLICFEVPELEYHAEQYTNQIYLILVKLYMMDVAPGFS